MDLKQFLQVLRRRWRSVVAVLVLCLAVAGTLIYIQTPMYESKARIFLNVDVRQAQDAYAAQAFLSARAETYADLAQSSELADRVIDTLDLDETAGELSGRISAEVLEGTVQIEIAVQDEEPRRAQTIADVVLDQFIEFIEELETPEGSATAPLLTARVTSEASYSAEKVSPQTVLYLVAAGIIGLLLGIATAVARQLLDRTIHTVEDVAKFTDAPVLASIGFDPDMRKAPLITDLGGFAARTEAFRVLRTSLQFVDLDHQPKVLAITSATPAEGKTMTATNLAIALAQTGRKTLIVDADLRRPRVASTLGLDPAVGFTTALVGKAQIQDVIQVHEKSGLHVLASGPKPPNPTEILQSRVTADLIRRLRGSYDMIVIDAPPLLPVADASVVSSIADGALMVVRHDRTTTDQAADAIARLQQVGSKVLGVVVNMVSKRAVGSYYYYYYEETDPMGRAPKAAGSANGKRKSEKSPAGRDA